MKQDVTRFFSMVAVAIGLSALMACAGSEAAPEGGKSAAAQPMHGGHGHGHHGANGCEGCKKGDGKSCAGMQGQKAEGGCEECKKAKQGGESKECACKGKGGHGHDEAHRADMQVFHFLLDNRAKIVRKVNKISDGVETVTESDDPAIVQKIREHVQSMRGRLEQKKPIHYRDPLFAAVFEHAAEIQMKTEETPKGIKVTETSSNPKVVALIQAHAEVVNLFVQNGREEMHKDHNVPQ